MYKVAFKNLGCKVNNYETEKMRDNIPQSFCEVNFNDIADVYIINTCSVTHIADRKSRQMIHRARKKNKNALIVICGCFVNNLQYCLGCKNEKQMVINTFDNKEKCDNLLFVDNSEKDKVWQKIVEYINKKENKLNIINNIKNIKNIFVKNKKYIDISTNTEIINNDISNDDKENDEVSTNKIRAFVKIEDGCNNFCSYCLIPYLRGRIKSRKEEDILNDVKNMVNKGKKEIILTGIDINAYGSDFENKNCNMYLSNLIKKVCDIDGVLRVRVGSLHPNIVNEEFVKSLVYDKKINNENIKKFCSEFHLSLQSGSDDVLKKMNRKYTVKEYEEAAKLIRKYFKNATITTDIIVGFPEETDKNFEETCNFVKKIKFYNPHIFKYSIRKNTNAEKMIQVDDIVKEKREKILIDICDKISNEIREKQIGKKVNVLVEEIKIIDGKYKAIGYTKEYMKMYVDLDSKMDELVGTEINVIVK